MRRRHGRRCNNRPYGRPGRRRHASQDKPKRTESVDGPRTLSGTVTGSAATAAAKDALRASTSNPLRSRQACPPRNACPRQRRGDERCLTRHTSSVSGYPQWARSLTLRGQNAPYHISAYQRLRNASARRASGGPNPDRLSADPYHALQTFPNAAGCTPWERRTAWIYPYAIYNEVPSRPQAATKRPAPTARAAAAPAPSAGQIARGRRSGYGATQAGRCSARNRCP